MRLPSHPIVAGQMVGLTSSAGLGLAGIYDWLIKQRPEAFSRITDEMRRLFPSAERLVIQNPTVSTVALSIVLTNGTPVGPDAMSEGMLYYLTLSGVAASLQDNAILIIEEPENGLHPARIKEVMQIFKSISERHQVLIATHSPLVINELKPEQVTVITRDIARGSVFTRMTDTQNFAERTEVYALGELWLSYADGTNEQGLVPLGH